MASISLECQVLSKNGWLEWVVEPGVNEEPASRNRSLEAESARSKATSGIVVLFRWTVNLAAGGMTPASVSSMPGPSLRWH